MVNPFETVILKLKDLGFFQFLLPFMLSSAIFYGLLRKSRLFGEPEKNITVNAVISLTIAFMIWASPIILGINLQESLSKFFVQGMIGTLIILLGLMAAGAAFPKGLGETLGEKLKSGSRFWIGVIAAGIFGGIVILFTSGMIDIFFPGFTTGEMEIPSDLMISIIVLIVLAVAVFAVVFFVGGEPKEGKKE